jgi:hypothetical protein
MFATQDKVRKRTGSIRGLILVAVRLMTVQVTKLPSYYRVEKYGLICFARPRLKKGQAHVVNIVNISNFTYCKQFYVLDRHLRQGNQ